MDISEECNSVGDSDALGIAHIGSLPSGNTTFGAADTYEENVSAHDYLDEVFHFSDTLDPK